MKVSSTVRRGADRKGAQATSLAAYPTKAALEFHASSLVLVHNHPSGKVEPSREDYEITQKIKAACQTVSIRVLDHIIIGENQYFSFSERNSL